MAVAAGKPDGFEFTCFTHDRSSVIRAAGAIQASLKQVGIEMETQLLQGRENSNKYWNLQTPEAYCSPNVGGASDPDVLLRRLFYSTSQRNFLHRPLANIDELLDQGDSTFDLVQRAKFYQEVDRYVIEEGLFITIAYQIDDTVVSDKLQGWDPHPGFLDGLNMAQSWLEK